MSSSFEGAPACRACGSLGITRHRIRSDRNQSEILDVFACEACGEYWIDGETTPAPEVLRRLGLDQ
ncbi:MAG: hypothetical protein ABR548_05380 [Actinomycetota bacterium]|nr:hypothetical protein [Actinomycetota bacterium]